MQTELAAAYHQVLSQFDLGRLQPNRVGLSEVFLPSAPASTSLKLLVVGQQTRGWWRPFSAVQQEDLPRYIESSMGHHRALLSRPPRRSKFGQFHMRAAKALGCSREEIGWANMFSLCYRKGAPRASSAFSEISELSQELLKTQLRVLQPEYVIFTTGPSYDRYVKSWFGDELTDSERIVPRRLWRFRLGAIQCFRINHPRCASGRQYQDDVLSEIVAGSLNTAPGSGRWHGTT